MPRNEFEIFGRGSIRQQLSSDVRWALIRIAMSDVGLQCARPFAVRETELTAMAKKGGCLSAVQNVAYWPVATDIAAQADVGFWGNCGSGRRLLETSKMTHLRHWQPILL